jgi:hypothetical protein
MAKKPGRASAQNRWLRPDEVPDKHPWPWWRRWLLGDQNITADIEFARVELSVAANAANTPSQIKTSRICQSMLQKCIDNHRRIFKNRIFVRQTLFQIMQHLILFTPRENLKAIWLSLKQRLEAAGKVEQDFFAKTGVVKQIERFVNEKRGNAEHEEQMRRLIKRVRTFLDERTMTDLWLSYTLQKTTNVCAVFGLLLVFLMPAIYLYENNCDFPAQLLSCKPTNAATNAHGIILMCLAGVLGGVVSMLFQSPEDGASSKSLPLVRLVFVRPILGGLAGLVLFFVAQTEVITAKYPSLYAAAVAFGFSERAIIKALTLSANQVGSSVTRALGHIGGTGKSSDGSSGSADEAPPADRSKTMPGAAVTNRNKRTKRKEKK